MDSDTPFNSERIIKEHISEADFKTYFVGFDLEKFRWGPFVDKLMDVIVDFAYGLHEGDLSNYDRRRFKEAAKSIYGIEKYDKNNIEHKKYTDEKDFFDKKYSKKGEIGELILHLLLRDFHKTLCLISKIHFKDSRGVPVHGFDAIHIQPDSKSLWLGESKLYHDGEEGVKELLKDIKNHFNEDYLRTEFALISKRKYTFEDKKLIPDIEYWFNLIDEHNKLEDIFKSVTIPLLCTYSSENFLNHKSETKEFIEAYEIEVKNLKKYFNANLKLPIKTNLNIILILFPIPSKYELIKRFNEKLGHAQRI